MAGSTISTTLRVGVTLGSANYPSPLVVTGSGAILPAVYAADGVYLPSTSAGGSVVNHGRIMGGRSAQQQQTAPPGAGIYLAASGTIDTTGSVQGGYAGGDQGYTGGSSIVLAAGGRLTNSGSVTGGRSFEGRGGNAVDASLGATVVNSGTLLGGLSAGVTGYNGGFGLSLYDTSVGVNSGVIRGGRSEHGSGGFGVDLQGTGVLANAGSIFGGSSGPFTYYAPGYGVRITGAGTLTNAGHIRGGAALGGGFGGIGVSIDAAGATLANTGTIRGGAGAGYGGGGIGLNVQADALVTNRGLIAGGAGGTVTVPSPAYPPGAGGSGVYLDGGTLTTSGTIAGGAGGTEAGSVVGQMGDALLFGTATSRLIVQAGAVFRGAVVANPSAGDVLEVSGPGVTSLAGLGAQVSGFAQIQQDSGAMTFLFGDNLVAAGTTLDIAGKIVAAGPLTDQGTIAIRPGGVLDLAATPLGTGALDLYPGATLVLGAAGPGGTALVLTGPAWGGAAWHLAASQLAEPTALLHAPG